MTAALAALGGYDADAEAWRAEALCAQSDPEAFYPEKGGNAEPAKRLCNGSAARPPCPVRDACLAWALDHNQQHGIWGGRTERERRELRRPQRAPRPIPHGTASGYRTHRRRGEQACAACREANRRASADKRGAA